MPHNRELVILLAEDDDGHAYLVQQNLTDAGLANRVVRVPNGPLLLLLDQTSDYTCTNGLYILRFQYLIAVVPTIGHGHNGSKMVLQQGFERRNPWFLGTTPQITPIPTTVPDRRPTRGGGGLWSRQ